MAWEFYVPYLQDCCSYLILSKLAVIAASLRVRIGNSCDNRQFRVDPDGISSDPDGGVVILLWFTLVGVATDVVADQVFFIDVEDDFLASLWGGDSSVVLRTWLINCKNTYMDVKDWCRPRGKRHSG